MISEVKTHLELLLIFLCGSSCRDHLFGSGVSEAASRILVSAGLTAGHKPWLSVSPLQVQLNQDPVWANWLCPGNMVTQSWISTEQLVWELQWIKPVICLFNGLSFQHVLAGY